MSKDRKRGRNDGSENDVGITATFPPSDKLDFDISSQKMRDSGVDFARGTPEAELHGGAAKRRRISAQTLTPEELAQERGLPAPTLTAEQRKQWDKLNDTIDNVQAGIAIETGLEISKNLLVQLPTDLAKAWAPVFGNNDLGLLVSRGIPLLARALQMFIGFGQDKANDYLAEQGQALHQEGNALGDKKVYDFGSSLINGANNYYKSKGAQEVKANTEFKDTPRVDNQSHRNAAFADPGKDTKNDQLGIGNK